MSNIIKKNDTFRGVPTIIMKRGIDVILLRLKGLKTLIITYEAGLLTEDQLEKSLDTAMDNLENDPISKEIDVYVEERQKLQASN